MAPQMGLNADNFSEDFIYDHLLTFRKLLKLDFENSTPEEQVLEIIKAFQSGNISYDEIKENFSNIDEAVARYLEPYKSTFSEFGFELNLSEDGIKAIYEHSGAFLEIAELFSKKNLEPKEMLLETLEIIRKEEIPYRDLELILGDLSGPISDLFSSYKKKLGIDFDLSRTNIKYLYESLVNGSGNRIKQAILDIFPELPSYLSNWLWKNNISLSPKAIEKRLDNVFGDIETTLDFLDEVGNLNNYGVLELVEVYNDLCDFLDFDALEGFSLFASTVISYGADHTGTQIITSTPDNKFFQFLASTSLVGIFKFKLEVSGFSAGFVDFVDDAKDTLEKIQDWGAEKKEEFDDWCDDVREWGADRLEEFEDWASDKIDWFRFWD